MQTGVDGHSDPDSLPIKVIRRRRDTYDPIWQRSMDNDMSTTAEAENNTTKKDVEARHPRASLI